MKNSLGREIPEYIEGYGKVRPYTGAFAQEGKESRRAEAKIPRSAVRGEAKLLSGIEEMLDRLPLKDGMTVSFHHHLRNGDRVTNLVMLAIAQRGIRDIHLAASGLFACHEPLVPLIEDGTITQISVSTFGPGPVAQAVSAGKLKKPAVLRTHGGRPRAIENGELPIDIAFIAAPSCDAQGNLNGSHGPSACGCLSYSYADARHADIVVAITDHLVAYPCCPAEISEDLVDYVVPVDSIGDPSGIVSGAMRVTTDPEKLAVAQRAADLLEQTGFIKEGMSFQTGVGGISLAVASKVREKMLEKNIRGSFGAGGIHGYFIKMLEEGLLRTLWDVQCFDIEAVENLAKDPRHMIMSASQYGNPENKGCVVNQLDVMILGAFEVDTDFNLNVITGSNGVIMSASGGNPDTAAGSKISVVVSSLMKKGPRCLIKKAVTTVATPGETVDAVVTDKGIAINPRRTDLLAALKDSDLPLVDIRNLAEMGEALGGIEDHPDFTNRIVAVAEYRDGTVIDVVRQVRTN